MSKEMYIGKQSNSITDELDREYRKMKRRARYLEEDVKYGHIDVDMENEKVTFVPSKEDSMQRLTELGKDFAEEQLIEDVIVNKATLLILQEAMKELDRQDQELINDLYYEELTLRVVAKKMNSSHVAVIKRRDKLLKKLRKFF